MDRVIIFIDGSNLYHGLKEALKHTRIDFQRFCSLLCGSQRRLVHVQIACHMLAFAFDNQYDTAILVSQDGDFAPVVGELLRLNKRVENAEFPHRLPSFLSKSCSDVIRLDTTFLQPCIF